VLVEEDVTAITPHMFELTLRVFLRRKLLDAVRGRSHSRVKSLEFLPRLCVC
jgi:hypothetical protein